MSHTVTKMVGRFLALVGVLLVSLTGAAWANDDPPGRVGRVSDLAGDLQLSNATTEAHWAAVGMNYPITTADEISVGPGGRAEVDFGDGFLRLAGETNVYVRQLDDRRVELSLIRGQLILSLQSVQPGEAIEVQTDNARVRILRPGTYRVDVNRDRSVTVLVVRSGEAALERSGASTVVRQGETATVRGHDHADLDLRGDFYTDPFDSWSETRDQRYEVSHANRYVPRAMIGWRDLDDHGDWRMHATYGSLWYPRTIAAGWAPYRDGRWVWVSPWGWTWVDEAPWGFAPFHYGRWVHVSGRWAWAPGRYTGRPVYAPALVTFIGGSGWSFSVTTPVFAWVPLGWREVYRPYYRSSDHYHRRVNRPYVINYTEIHAKPPVSVQSYANVRVSGAITSVSEASFSGGRRVSENLVRVPQRAVVEAPVLATAPSVKPIPFGSGAMVREAAPSSPAFKPSSAGGGVREVAPAGTVQPGRVVAPREAPSAVRESKPQTAGSGRVEVQASKPRGDLPQYKPSGPAVREQGPFTLRPNTSGTGGGHDPVTGVRRPADPPMRRPDRIDIPPAQNPMKPTNSFSGRVAPSGVATVKPLHPTESARTVAPGGGGRAPQGAPVGIEKPFVGKPEGRIERRAEPRTTAPADISRSSDGARLK